MRILSRVQIHCNPLRSRNDKKGNKILRNFIKKPNLISHTGNIPFSLQKKSFKQPATSIPINLFVEKEIVTPKPKEEAYIRCYVNITKTTFYSIFVVKKLSFYYKFTSTRLLGRFAFKLWTCSFCLHFKKKKKKILRIFKKDSRTFKNLNFLQN